MADIPEHVYRSAENAEVECEQQGCRRRDCNGVICRKSIDAALAAIRPRAEAAEARLAQAERVGVTDDAVRQAGDILMQHGLNAPEQVIYQAARAILKAALQPQEQGR